MANVDDRDNWKVHFADTMRGGQYVNNWRMAHFTRECRPVSGNSKGGRVFDRTPTAGFFSGTSAGTSIRGW